MYRAHLFLELLECLEVYLQEAGFTKITLKQTSDLLCRKSGDLIEYCFDFKGYSEYKEISSYIDYSRFHPDTMKNLSAMKQRIIKKNGKAGVVFRELTGCGEVEVFYNVLRMNLEKFGITPVHTLEELIDLWQNRLKDEIKFFGAYLGEQLVAGTMVFDFFRQKCAHTQYLAADLSYNKLSPMSYVYYKIAEWYCVRQYRYLSWGIATEDRGAKLNLGLLRNKEEYGSEHLVIRTFEKEI